MLPKNKIVLMPITVPEGKYCWEYAPMYAICGNFDNEGGHPKCELGFYPLERAITGIFKPDECNDLKSIEEN